MSKSRITSVVRGSGEERFQVLYDLLEETGWDPELVVFTGETFLTLNDQGYNVVPVEVWAKVLGLIAARDYSKAVGIFRQIKALAVEDPVSGRHVADYIWKAELVDSMNSAAFKRKGTWQKDLDAEKVSLVVGEQDLGPWDVTDFEGRETRRPWTSDFPPEWDHGLEREFEFGSKFKTVYYGDGGNFGPAFDRRLKDSDGVWVPIRQFAAGRDVDCPLVHGDSNEVILEHTFMGEWPGSRCRFCESEIGDGHGTLYMGEMGGAVFKLDELASVEVIEVVSRDLYAGPLWELVAFDTEGSEVDVPQIDAANRHGFDTAALASGFVESLRLPGHTFRAIVVTEPQD